MMDVPFALELAALSDVGTERGHNEDHCGHLVEGPASGVVVVADGVSSNQGGEVASQSAVEVTLRAYGELPAALGAGKRLHRAVQQANIDIHDRALVVPELRGMATTLTAVAIQDGAMTAAHVGDSRLYLVRGGAIRQLSKDHTVVGERVRLGVLSRERARHHPDRSTWTRSVGRELIVAFDRISMAVAQGDVLIVCSDGLYNVLDDDEMAAIVAERAAGAACKALVQAANERGTLDNLTAAVVRMTGPTPPPRTPAGIGATVRSWFGKRGG
jgi:protein phosphatase